MKYGEGAEGFKSLISATSGCHSGGVFSTDDPRVFKKYLYFLSYLYLFTVKLFFFFFVFVMYFSSVIVLSSNLSKKFLWKLGLISMMA